MKRKPDGVCLQEKDHVRLQEEYNSWKRLEMTRLWLLECSEIHFVAFNHLGYCRKHNIGTGYLLNSVFFGKMWDIENTLFLKGVLQFFFYFT